ncbi:hypothetical protein ACLMAB_16135 [Brevibacillus laterosporus]
MTVLFIKRTPQLGNGPYSHLNDSKHVGPGKDFTAAQKRKIIEENMKQNGGVVKSDQSGQIATKPQKVKRVLHPIRMNGKFLEIKVGLTVSAMLKCLHEKKIEINPTSYPPT